MKGIEASHRGTSVLLTFHHEVVVLTTLLPGAEAASTLEPILVSQKDLAFPSRNVGLDVLGGYFPSAISLEAWMVYRLNSSLQVW